METLVLVLTDVQGSTRLWQDEPAAMDAAMARHHALLHAAIDEHGGWRPVDQGEGDAVFAAFRSATAAIAAVVQIQRALAAEPWPTSTPLKVRIGVHLGEVTERGGNLYGDPVNRCARLRGLGTGGQTLISAAVYELVHGRLPPEIGLTDLGRHQLKDLARSEHVWQVDVAGLPCQFPTLDSARPVAHNLPSRLGPVIGRDAESQTLRQLLASNRLVSVLGFGGMGKTSLAVSVAQTLVEQHPGGVWFVDLAAATDTEGILRELASVLHVAEGGAGLQVALVQHLNSREPLIILDNVEQIPHCAGLVLELLNQVPSLRLLVTSREPLRIAGERELLLRPLSLPEQGSLVAADGEESAALCLFKERVADVCSQGITDAGELVAAAEICRRLEGHPLALELAAARCRSLSPQALLSRLTEALASPSGLADSRPDRHQTLAATIAWSVSMLTEDEQLMLQRFATFPGTASLDAVEQICGPAHDTGARLDALGLLMSLVDKNLIRRAGAEDAGPGDRFAMLVSVRDYAREQLSTEGERKALEDRHAAWFGQSDQSALGSDDTLESAVGAVMVDLHNVRAAFAHQMRTTPKEAHRFRPGYFLALEIAGWFDECLSATQAAIDAAPEPSIERTLLLRRQAAVHLSLGNRNRGRELALLAVRDAGWLDAPGVELLALSLAASLASSLVEGMSLLDQLQDAARRHESSGATYPPPSRSRRELNYAISDLLRYVEPDRAIAALHAVPDIVPGTDNDQLHRIAVAFAEMDRGNVENARAALGLHLLDDGFISSTPIVRISLLILRGRLRIDTDAGAREESFQEALTLALELRSPALVVLAATALADLLIEQGRAEDAERALSTGLTSLQGSPEPTHTACLTWRLAALHRLRGEPLEAARLVEQAWQALNGRELEHLPDVLGCLNERAHQSRDSAERLALLRQINSQRGDFLVPGLN